MPRTFPLTCIQPCLPVDFTIPTRTSSPYHGRPSELPTLVQDDQVRHHSYPVELQHVPFRASFLHIRVPELQTQDLPAMHGQSIGEYIQSLHFSTLPPLHQLGARRLSPDNPRQLPAARYQPQFDDESFGRGKVLGADSLVADEMQVRGALIAGIDPRLPGSLAPKMHVPARFSLATRAHSGLLYDISLSPSASISIITLPLSI